MADRLTSRKPLFFAFLFSSLIVAAFSLALLLNEDLRKYTIAKIEELTDEQGKKVKRVKIEKPEPNEEQVREISRNQERKKREELKEKARELRETIYEIEEVVEAQKKLKKDKPTDWEELAENSEKLVEESLAMQENLQAEEAPEEAEAAEPDSEALTEDTREYSELVQDLAESEVTPGKVAKAVEKAKEVAEKAGELEEKLAKAEKPEDETEAEKLTKLQDQATDLAKKAREHYKQVEEFSRRPEALQNKATEQENAEDEPELAESDVERSSEKELAETEEPEGIAEVENDPSKLELDEELGTAMTEETEAMDMEGTMEPELPETLDPNLNQDLADGEISPLGNELPSDQQLDEMTTADLYEKIQEMTGQVDESFAEGQAAEMANRKDMSLEDAREQVYKPETPKGPDLKEQLSQNQPSTREEFQQFNEALDDAANAAEQMSRAANNRKSALMGESPPSPQNQQGEQSSQNLQAALQQRNQLGAQMRMLASNQGRKAGNVQDMRQLMAQNYQLTSGGSSSGFNEAEAIDRTHQTAMRESTLPSSARLDTKRVLSQAVPGRRLDMDSERQGWIFLDTWYVIGPWERPNKKDSFEVEFPPETLVDLDATYKGKVSRYTKEPMELKWRFVQTENIRINPPDEINDAVYYGYTEVFCEAATEVTIAVASDDMAKLWVNDLVVFEDNGLSAWRMDEGFRTILLKPGYNTVLIRLENGPSICYFSVLMCPTEALRK